ncbi:MAG: flagellin [Vampirovibrionales bacterium]|nr:flagellin [Vampirovibrionales bacterium]
MYAGNLSLVIQGHLKQINREYETTLERLTTNKKINRSSDDPSGSYIATQLNTRYRGYTQASENTQTAINLLQTASDGLTSLQEQLTNLRAVALEAAAGGTPAQFTAWSASATTYKAAGDLITNTTTFNGTKPLDGSANSTFNIQAGPDGAASNQINIGSAISNNNTIAGLGLSGVTLADQTNAAAAVTSIDAALATIANRIAALGTFDSVLTTHADFLSTAAENMSAAEGTLVDADIAAESARYSQLGALQSSAATMLLKANTNMTLLSFLYGS